MRPLRSIIIYIYTYLHCWASALLIAYRIDIKKVDNKLTHEMHVKDRYTNVTFIDKLTKWH